MRRTSSRHWVTGLAAGAAVSLLPALALASGGGEGGGQVEFPTFMMIGSIVNFAILVWVVVRFGGPKMSMFLLHRKDTLERTMRDAATLREQAREALEDIRAKEASLDEERQRVIDEFRALGEAERQRILAESEIQAKRIREEATMLAESEATRARKDLERELVALALEMTEKTLRDQLAPAKQRDLVNQTIASIEALSAEQPAA